ncbi:ABC transporter ATP-binding protein [Cytobacillus sp. IB215316]|uniref:ABC transporter ATP-binding protein n=1 Tax=Cytobacillus sp. IB215316 TaxID=3097354 RepID=UPI002A10D0A4|nr:ABC transporter ATP-binding protein [Cytobacillus sp. IB215316]MDX8361679.1 ABC transporter ATP-binding protein [Cytobacillus sp. IB215316]
MKIYTQNLSQKYGSKTALHNLNITLEEDKIYGLLGRNGAGKTTFMQILAGHILPSKGKILINNEQPFNNRNVLKSVCLINESNNFKRKLKLKHVLHVASKFYPTWSKQTADHLLHVFNLDPNMSARSLSKGMESALGIIIGLSSGAKITIFDEPYIGLDASARYKFYDLLLDEYKRNPRTFILSTHLIDEASNLFEEILLIQEGELLLHKTADELQEMSLQISGNIQAVNEYCHEKNVIFENEMIGRKTAMLFGEKLNIQEAKLKGLDVGRCNIQELMVHLTEKEGGRLYA